MQSAKKYLVVAVGLLSFGVLFYNSSGVGQDVRKIEAPARSTLLGVADWRGTGMPASFYSTKGQGLGAREVGAGAWVGQRWSFFTEKGARVNLPAGAQVIGGGYDLRQQGKRALFYMLPDDSLHAEEYIQSSSRIFTRTYAWHFDEANASPYRLAKGSTIVGAGLELRNNGHQATFLRTASGQLAAFESATFGPKSGRTIYGWRFADESGKPLLIDQDDGVFASGADLNANGRSSVFIRDRNGRLRAWEVEVSGAAANLVHQSWQFSGEAGQAEILPPGSRFAGFGNGIGDDSTLTLYFEAEDGLQSWELGIAGEKKEKIFGVRKYVLPDGKPFSLLDTETVVGATVSKADPSRGRLYARTYDSRWGIYNIARRPDGAWQVTDRRDVAFDTGRALGCAISTILLGDREEADGKLLFVYQLADGGSVHGKLVEERDFPSKRFTLQQSWHFINNSEPPTNLNLRRGAKLNLGDNAWGGASTVKFSVSYPGGALREVVGAGTGKVISDRTVEPAPSATTQ